jgi:hypothetical protein
LLGARVQRYLAVVVALWTVTVLAFGQSKEAPTPRALANNAPAYVKLRHIKLGNESATITNFILKRDGGTFVFRSGAFYFLEAVDDKITGAVFVGDGSFFLTPPIEIERRNLALLTGGRQFEEQFRTAVFRFTDSAEQEIRQAATGEKALNATEAETALRAV